MYRYDKIKDKVFNGKVALGAKNKDLLNHMSKFAIQMIRDGKQFSDLPIHLEGFPSLAAIISNIDNSKELSDAKSEAEKIRLIIQKEQLIKAVEIFKYNPTKENENIVAILERTYSKFSSQQKEAQVINIHYTSKYEDDFWEGAGPVPENPRIDGKTVSAEEWLKNEGN